MVSKDGQATCFLDKNVKIKNGVNAVNKYLKKLCKWICDMRSEDIITEIFLWLANLTWLIKKR